MIELTHDLILAVVVVAFFVTASQILFILNWKAVNEESDNDD